jgi:uncharacterized protein (TIGR02996 family)
MPRYMLQEGDRLRFWEIERDERVVLQRWGSFDREEGRSRDEHRSPGAAKEAVLKLVGERTALGWRVPVSDEHGEPVKPLRTAPAMEQLEKAIEARPDDADGWRVYADWLQQHGDPRGELAALQQKRLTQAQVDAFVMAHRAQLLGPLDDVWQGGDLRLSWKHGFIRTARLVGTGSSDLTAPDIVRLLCQLPSSRFLMTLELATTMVERSFPVLAQSDRSRHLRRLVLSGQSWFSTASIQPVLDACPNLKELVVRHLAGSGVRHDELELLSITQPIGEELEETLGASALPKLSTLSLLPGPVSPLAWVVKRSFPGLELLALVGDRYPVSLLDTCEASGLFTRLTELRFSQPSPAIIAELPKRFAKWPALKRIEVSGRLHPAQLEALTADPRVVPRGRASALSKRSSG